jgi:multicomponent Na+:H+ antiporter subunit F
MFTAAAVAVLAAAALATARAVRGPGLFDRILAGNSVGTGAILILALVGFLTDRPEFLDIAITYALLNIVGMLAILKFVAYGDLGHDGRREGGR